MVIINTISWQKHGIFILVTEEADHGFAIDVVSLHHEIIVTYENRAETNHPTNK